MTSSYERLRAVRGGTGRSLGRHPSRGTCCRRHRQHLQHEEGCLLNQDDAAPVDYTFDMTGSDGLYIFHWPALHIQAEVSRMDKKAEKGEITWTSSRPVGGGHLLTGNVGLTSVTSKNAMVRALTEEDGQVRWKHIVEQCCTAALNDFRAGLPEVQLTGDVVISAESRWLIEPIVQHMNPTLIYGPGSSGKSWFAQYLAVLADAGMNHGGFGVEPANVLYLDWETDRGELGTRITMIRKGLGFETKSGVWYKSMNQGLAIDIEAVKSIVMKREITFLVLDSLGAACMGEPESADVVLGLFRALRSLRVTSLCVDHTNKEGYLFGSIYKFNEGRHIFEIKKDQKPEDDKLVFGLFHRKANNSRMIRDLGFELSFADPEQVAVVRKDVRDTPLEAEQSIPQRVLNTYSRNGSATYSVTEMAEELSTETKTVTDAVARTVLERLVRDGSLIKHHANGSQQYGIPAKEEEEDKWTIA